MNTNYRHFNVRLTPGQWDRVSKLAREQKRSIADVIRSAIDSSINVDTASTTSARRLARITEYQHLAIDVIMREQFPEVRDRLIAETDKRLEQYHGA